MGDGLRAKEQKEENVDCAEGSWDDKGKESNRRHKGLCEGNLGLGLVSFPSYFYFIYVFFKKDLFIICKYT